MRDLRIGNGYILRVGLLALSALVAAPCAADGHQPSADRTPVAAPPPPPRVESGQTLEPEITIVEKEDRRVTEYRVGDRVVAVKVEPRGAPTYYLVDTDGDGDLETQSNELKQDWIHSWVLLRW